MTIMNRDIASIRASIMAHHKRTRLCVNVLDGFSDDLLEAILELSDGDAAARFAALSIDAGILCNQAGGRLPGLVALPDEPAGALPPEPRCECGRTPVGGLPVCEECLSREYLS